MHICARWSSVSVPSLVPAAVCLVVAAAVGVITHELAHALALRLGGVPCRVTVLPKRGDTGRYRLGVRGPLARVTPTRVPADLPPWRLRVAAMAPLCLATPLALSLVGILPDPFAGGSLALQAATIAWLGCAIPSPRDFSLLWYPEAAIATRGRAMSTGD